MPLPDLKTLLLWALGIGLIAALATAGMERTRAVTARKDLAEYRAASAESARLAERANRTQEQTWRTRVDGVIHDGQQQIAAARADAAAAAAGERRLRDQLTAYRAAVRAAAAAPAAAAGGAPATDPLDLLADLFGRADARAGELAAIADERGSAGSVCERFVGATEN